MSEEEKIRRLAELKTLLEKRVRELETELDGLRALLEFVDAFLLEKGFKRAELVRPAEAPAPPPVEAAPPTGHERVIPIKTVTGEPLANLYVAEDVIRVVPVEDKKFNVNTPPFTSCLLNKVLSKMQEKDRKAVMAGEIPPDKILSYQVLRDGDIIREMVIRNVTPERLRELKSTIRWTLEKMWEKMARKP